MSAPRVGLAEFRIELDGIVVVGDGVVDFTVEMPRQTAVEVAHSECSGGFRVVGIDSDRMTQVSDTLVVFLLVGPGDAAVTVREPEFGIEPGGCRAIGDCLVVLLLLKPGIPAPAVRLDELRIEPNGLGEIGDRLVVLALALPGYTSM